MTVEVLGGGDYDLSWFHAGAVAPIELAERVVQAFPDEGIATVKQLADATGLEPDRVEKLVTILVTKKWVKPLASGRTGRLELSDSGRELAATQT